MRRACLCVAVALLLPASIVASAPGVLFEDSFDGKLGEGWSWIREDPAAWRIEKGALEIRVEPGVADTVKNALVRTAPDRTKGRYAIDLTVRNTVRPTNQFEQAGITWYTGGRPVFKLVKELIDGDLWIIPAKVSMRSEMVQLRLVVSAEGWTAQFRPDGKGDFVTAARGPLPPPADDRVSIQCYNGPADAEHWIRFDDFRIVDLDAEAAARMPLLHPMFTDHMVLQRDVPVPVWGWAASGAEVTVRLAGKTATARADDGGRWMARLDAMPAGGPHTLEVGGAGTKSVEDVLIGDVWICSGQSNMEWPVALSNDAQAEIAAADHPRIRLFTVPKVVALEPRALVDGAAWRHCSPSTVGDFSAVGYFFGRELEKQLAVPIGLIDSSWGGTIAEAWTSTEALRAMEDFRPALDQLAAQIAAEKAGSDAFERILRRWWAENDPGSADGAGWQAPSWDATDWKSMDVPAGWETAGLDGFDGIVWFRKEIGLPEAWKGKEATLRLGPIDDRDTTFVNGVRVGEGDSWTEPRTYKVPAGTLVAGRNVIAVRVLDTGGGGGLIGNADQYSLQPADGSAAALAMAGSWRYRDAAPLSKLAPAPQKAGSNPNVVTVLYNGMIAPLVPFAIRGAIWYQGESNAGRAEQYRRLLPTLIADWRHRFGVGTFPFLVVQLANFMAPQKEPVEPGWAELREAQLLTALADPKVGLAVITDIGEANDIHPRNKQDVGKRLALEALRIEHGRDIVSTGPVYRDMRVVGNEAILRFDRVGGGLVAKGGDLKGFAVAGGDGSFRWGVARIRGDEVVVSSPEVPEPKAVRYGWANNPDCNLYNREGLPATPFRTDAPR